MLYACLYTLFVRQTCNLPYTVGVLMNVITHAQFDVRLFCCCAGIKFEVTVVVSGQAVWAPCVSVVSSRGYHNVLWH